MYINFQQNRVSRSVKTVQTNLFTKNFKLHKLATCNWNFEKSRLSDMHCLLTDIQIDFFYFFDLKFDRRYYFNLDAFLYKNANKSFLKTIDHRIQNVAFLYKNANKSFLKKNRSQILF